MCVEIFDHVFFDSLSAEMTHDFSMESEKSEEAITHILYHLRENKKNIIGILNCESGELFLRFFGEYLDRTISNKIVETTSIIDEIPRDFLVSHISSSFINIVK